MDYVKGEALSRRDLFRRSAAAGVAIVASSAIPAGPFLAQTPSRVVDLTYTLTKEFPSCGGDPQVFDEEVFNFAEHSYKMKMLRVIEHVGTHIDAPSHFTDGGTGIDEVLVEMLVCPLARVDIREKADDNLDAQVTPDDLAAWIAVTGLSLPNDRATFCSWPCSGLPPPLGQHLTCGATPFRTYPVRARA